MAIAGHQPVAPPVQLLGEGGHVALDLGFEGGHQHPAGALPDDLVEPAGGFRLRVDFSQYSQHRRSFPPACHRQRISFWSTTKVRRALERVVDP